MSVMPVLLFCTILLNGKEMWRLDSYSSLHAIIDNTTDYTEHLFSSVPKAIQEATATL